jgi:hypothetical protein
VVGGAALAVPTCSRVSRPLARRVPEQVGPFPVQLRKCPPWICVAVIRAWPVEEVAHRKSAEVSKTSWTHRTVVSEDIKQLRLAFAPSFKARGFRKENSIWRKAFRDSIVAFAIGGSPNGRRYYLSLGAYFRRALNPPEHAGEFRCHVRVRVSELVPDRSRLSDLLDFEKPIALAHRLVELDSLVSAWGVPWLNAMSTCHSARIYMSEHAALSMFVVPSVWTLLALPSGAQHGAAADDRPQAGDRG